MADLSTTNATPRTLFDSITQLSVVTERIYGLIFIPTPEEALEKPAGMPDNKITLGISEVDRITDKLRRCADRLEGLGK